MKKAYLSIVILFFIITSLFATTKIIKVTSIPFEINGIPFEINGKYSIESKHYSSLFEREFLKSGHTVHIIEATIEELLDEEGNRDREGFVKNNNSNEKILPNNFIVGKINKLRNEEYVCSVQVLDLNTRSIVGISITKISSVHEIDKNLAEKMTSELNKNINNLNNRSGIKGIIFKTFEGGLKIEENELRYYTYLFVKEFVDNGFNMISRDNSEEFNDMLDKARKGKLTEEQKNTMKLSDYFLLGSIKYIKDFGKYEVKIQLLNPETGDIGATSTERFDSLEELSINHIKAMVKKMEI